MTRIISVLNFKGGTGKTTTVVNVGMGLALRGQRVLAIDLDSQGSVAGSLGVRFERSMADVLMGDAAWYDCVVRARTRLDILPADRRLADVERTLASQRTPMDILDRRLVGLQDAGYEFILLDCPPSIDVLSECALQYSKEVFVPVSMDYLALVGARMAVIEVLRARRLLSGRSARLSLVIPCFYEEKYEKSQETIQTLGHHFASLVTEPIRYSTRLAEAPSHGMTIFEYDPSGPGSRDYARLVERIANDAEWRDTQFPAKLAEARH